MKKVELLAPAKNLETAIAAIDCGADAVYIGASDFGARENASNPLSDIETLVNYAHIFNVKVHVTINTILNNQELERAVEMVKTLYNIGVDAIIVQDFGLLQAAIEGKLPPIQIHMSTQCDIRTLEKAKFFDAIGVSRIILARELSVEKISEICKSVNCEVETFVHGALCVSYSGQCYMSYANGGRSANKGACAQPCRKKYSLVDSDGKLLKDGHLLSLKDFNASNDIEKLINAGVKSFKIEGRLKDISYVKNVVLYYRKLIDEYAKKTSAGAIFTDFEPNLNKIFNRGFTDYFLNGRTDCYNFLTPKFIGEKLGKANEIGPNYIIINAKISPQDGLCFVNDNTVEGFLVNRVDGNKIYPNKMPKIISGTTIYRNFDSVFCAKTAQSSVKRKIAIEYVVNTNKIYVYDEDGNNVCKEMQTDEKPKNAQLMKQNLIKQLKKTGDTPFYPINIKFETDEIPFLSLGEINSIRRELLSLLKIKRIEQYKRILQKPICYAHFPQKVLDFRANVMNSEAEKFYNSCGSLIEQYALEKSNAVKPGIELMRTKHCLKYAVGMCSKDTKMMYLQDDKGKKYPLKFDCKNCEMVVLSP